MKFSLVALLPALGLVAQTVVASPVANGVAVREQEHYGSVVETRQAGGNASANLLEQLQALLSNIQAETKIISTLPHTTPRWTTTDPETSQTRP